MVVLDIAAPILLMFGITMTNSANVSLLNNFEIIATSIIALVIFKEVVSKRLWIAILLVTVASAILTFEGEGSFVFNKGSLFVLGVIFSLFILNERPSIQFYVALAIMIISTVIMVKDTISLQHTHEHEHKHIHTHIHVHGSDSENHTHKHELANHQHSHCV